MWQVKTSSEENCKWFDKILYFSAISRVFVSLSVNGLLSFSIFVLLGKIRFYNSVVHSYLWLVLLCLALALCSCDFACLQLHLTVWIFITQASLPFTALIKYFMLFDVKWIWRALKGDFSSSLSSTLFFSSFFQLSYSNLLWKYHYFTSIEVKSGFLVSYNSFELFLFFIILLSPIAIYDMTFFKAKDCRRRRCRCALVERSKA